MKRKLIEEFIDKHLFHVKDLVSLSAAQSLTDKNIYLLLSIPSNKRDKDKLKSLYFLRNRINLYKDLFIQSAIEEQALFLSTDSIDNYRYKARFNVNNINMVKHIKGYHLLQKHGYYNRLNNPSGVVKDHRFSINEGIKRNIKPEILGHLSNCEFLLYKDNIRKSDKCSITYTQLLEEIKKFDAALADVVIASG